MSINTALLTGVSGLLANSSALAAISDNIANSNTVGYKTVDTNFSDVVTNATALGRYDSGGVIARTAQLVSQQGTLSTTTSGTDLAIKGQGFFVTTTTSQPSATDPRSFTRAGSFTVDSNGNLKNAAGLYLQGFPVNADGTATISPSSASLLQTINVGTVGGTASATTQASINANLNASQAVSAAASATTTAASSGSTWSYDLPFAASSATVKVTDSTGAVVYTGAASGLSKGTNSYTWTGGTVGSAYTLSVSGTDSSGAALPAIPVAASGGYDPSTNSMAAYSSTAGTGTKPDFTVSMPVSDSQGGQRTLQLDLLKSSSANTWYAELVATPASNITEGSGLSNGQIAVGALAFNADGSINMTSSSLFNGATSPTIAIGASGTTPAAGAVSWGQTLGVSAQSIALSLNKSPGGITQFASSSITQSVDTNGTQFGNLTKVTVDNQGFVTAAYDNGVTRKIAQVAVATFTNPDGLTAVSGDSFQVSAASGAYNLKAAGTGGAGTIAPSTLESSTVDLSQQFANLITTQQAYSANAKIMTTAEQMLQTLINIKQ